MFCRDGNLYYKNEDTGEIAVWTEKSGLPRPPDDLLPRDRDMEQAHVKWLLDHLSVDEWNKYFAFNRESLMYLIHEGSRENFGRRIALYEFMKQTMDIHCMNPMYWVALKEFGRNDIDNVRNFLRAMVARPLIDCNTHCYQCAICKKEIDPIQFVTFNEKTYHEQCWFNFRMFG